MSSPASSASPSHATAPAPAVHVEVWSDYVCPFCYLAEPALNQVAHDASVTVTWRAFELRPAPEPTLDPQGDYLRTIWTQSVYPMAERVGLTLKLPPVQPRSRLAHEAAAFAATHDRAGAMQHALFKAFFEHGQDLGDPTVLTALAPEASLNAGELAAALNHHDHLPRVLEEEQLARNLGLSGVPAIVIRVAGARYDQAVLVEGAQPVEVLRHTITQVRAEAAAR